MTLPETSSPHSPCYVVATEDVKASQGVCLLGNNGGLDGSEGRPPALIKLPITQQNCSALFRSMLESKPAIFPITTDGCFILCVQLEGQL